MTTTTTTRSLLAKLEARLNEVPEAGASPEVVLTDLDVAQLLDEVELLVRKSALTLPKHALRPHPDERRLYIATHLMAGYIQAGIYPTDKVALTRLGLEIADELLKQSGVGTTDEDGGANT